MQRKLMTAVMLTAVATTTLATSGCKNLFRAYRIDIVQGQTVTQEQADQIKAGAGSPGPRLGRPFGPGLALRPGLIGRSGPEAAKEG